ncbi:MAG: phage holin family protein [Clostridiales bacterium]|nr:phage holin family protein [Clostridiales bacterium]MCD8147794.1 phage holin family protein [Clostridiales bacterium]
MTYLITCAFIALDFITGLVQALATKTFSSSIMREGLFHKVGLILCMILGILVDYAQNFVDLGVTVPVAGAICAYICVMEVGSIIENVCKIDPEIMPEKLTGFFASLKGGTDDE